MSDKELIYNSLYKKYSKLMLSKKEVCAELNFSERTLNRRIQNQEAIPPYVVDGGKYLFPLTSLCNYLVALQSL